MKVFIACSYGYSTSKILGVYSTVEKAVERIEGYYMDDGVTLLKDEDRSPEVVTFFLDKKKMPYDYCAQAFSMTVDSNTFLEL